VDHDFWPSGRNCFGQCAGIEDINDHRLDTYRAKRSAFGGGASRTYDIVPWFEKQWY
jgi:hypothetical protein